jgi:4-hydroxy-tetrahydrodipicolinate reductase
MTRLTILGATGRMGQAVATQVHEDDRFEIVGAIHRANSAEPLAATDVVVDFSSPQSLMSCLDKLPDGAAVVSGTTGLTPDEHARLQDRASVCAVVYASNFSLGVNHLLRLLPELAVGLGQAFDKEIIETHHRGKADAPSGTALAILAALQSGAAAAARHGRQGTPGPKPDAEIGVHAVRSGSVVGRHSIVFGGPGESITVTHEALTRATFARGALEAAAWLHGRPAGLYSMADVLGSRVCV